MILDAVDGSNPESPSQIVTHDKHNPYINVSPPTNTTTSSSSSPNNDHFRSDQEFPCMERSRCYLTEKDLGSRLSCRSKGKTKKKLMTPGKLEKERVYGLDFTKNRSRQEEWYITFQLLTTTASPSTPTTTMTGDNHHGFSSSHNNNHNKLATTVRTIQLQHVLTGQYLHTDAEGRVGTQPYPSQWTTWILQKIDDGDNHVSNPTTNTNTNNNHYEDGPALYTLLPRAHAPKALTYTANHHQQGHHHPPNGEALGYSLTTTLEHPSVFELEFTSGELVYMSNPVVHAHVRCNPLGKLSMSTRFGGWQVFRFIEVGHYGHVAIASWTHSNKYLSSDSDGKVQTTAHRLGHWEKWKLIKSSNGVWIESVAHRGRYLSIADHVLAEQGQVLQTTTKPSDYATWHLEAAHLHVYYLSAMGSNCTLQIGSNRKGPFLTKHRKQWEEWKMERTNEGYVTFCSRSHEKFLGCNSGGGVHTTSTKGDWSLWEMVESPHGGSCFQSKAHPDRHLSYYDNHLCTTAGDITEQESWRLEPRLPSSISGPKIAALGAAGVLGVALTVAMPYAVLGVVEAVGLSATELGIAAGLSAEALAGIGGGALLGAGVVGTTAAVVDSQEKKLPASEMAHDTEMAEDNLLMSSMRPICAWRSW